MHHLSTPTCTIFHKMLGMAGPGCRSWRGISWQPPVLRARGQTALPTKVARPWQGCMSLEIKSYFPTEPELTRTYCTDQAMPAWASQSQKHHCGSTGLTRPCSGPCWTVEVSQEFVPHSKYPSDTGSVNAKDIPSSFRSLCFLCSSRWS